MTVSTTRITFPTISLPCAALVWTIEMCISTSCREAFRYRLVHQTPFGKIPCDQTIEETINKDTQIAGGTKGFSLKSGAVQKYYLNAEHRSIFLRQLREMVSLGGSRLNHPDLQQSRILKDEADVQSLVNLMEDSWINPFRFRPRQSCESGYSSYATNGNRTRSDECFECW